MCSYKHTHNSAVHTSFEGNTNTLTDDGNADIIATKLNKLFAINNNVEIHLKGSTTSSSSEKNMTNIQSGGYDIYRIDGVQNPNNTLNDLLDGRARVGRTLLINAGVRDVTKLKISKHHVFNSDIGVISRPNPIK
ncbi:MAG: hypothetical protein ACJ04Q_06845 [Flavobacteriales bacterium]